MIFNMEILVDSDMIASSALGLSHEEAIDLICKIDLAHADTGFTEDLIKRLVSSMKAEIDAGADEISLPFIDWEQVK
jgi:hypothetical protein